jgi:lysophospholipase L1-like esterase
MATKESAPMAEPARPGTGPRPRRLSLRKKLLFSSVVLAFLLGLLLLGEFTARAWLWAKHGVPGKSYGLWQYDAELGAIHAPNSYNSLTQTNNYGFRGREDVLDPKPPGSLRVLCYGGSTTYCYNLPDGETWPERLQQRLRSLPEREHDQVLNGGHVSWSLGHVYLLAKRELPALRPDVVVLYSGINEVTNASYLRAAGYDLDELRKENRFGVIAKNYDQCHWLTRNSALVRYCKERFVDPLTSRPAAAGHAPKGSEPTATQTGGPDQPFESSWEWVNYKHLLSEMIDLIRQNGGTPLFVVQVGNTKSAKIKPNLRFTAEGAAVVKEMGVTVCDPRPVFARHEAEEKLFKDTDIHLSATGADLLADEVFQALRDQVQKTPDNRPQ